MDCREAQGLFSLFLDGELDARTALSLQGHVEGCPACGGVLAEEADLREAVRDRLRATSAPPRLRRSIRKALLREGGGWAWLVTSRPWQVAAAVALLLLAGGLFSRYDGRDLRGIVEGAALSHQMYAKEEDPAEFRAVREDLLLPQYQRRLPFELALPPFTQVEARLLGGRLSLLMGQKAAFTLYRMGAEPLSLFTVDRAGVRLPSFGGRPIAGRTVFFGEDRGYEVAVWEEGKCIYALVGRELLPFLSKAFSAF